MTKLEDLKAAGDAPEWMGDEGFAILSKGYLLPNETPRDMYKRVAEAAAQYTPDPKLYETKFFDAMWKNWLCPASPVLSNMGTTRGLPISCNSIHVGDSVHSIFDKSTELAMLTKYGAGVGIYMGDLRARGADIRGNGASEGVVPWAKLYDTTISSVSQGSTRRGAGAVFLDMDHGDIDEFLRIRRPTGDMNRRCLNLNHGVCISNEWMEALEAGDEHKRALWQEVLRTRVETGEPYLIFLDNINDQNPDCYKQRNLQVKTSNICSEITLYTDKDHSFVCCLSSLNLVRWHEWAESDLPHTATVFLDAVMEEYLTKSDGVKGLEPARNFARKSRALGIGVLGWHTLLQQKSLPFDSMQSMMLNAEIFRTIRAGAETATKMLAECFGEPEWCEGSGRRNTHLMAVAPTVSNSAISGGHSAGIEPIAANIWAQKSNQGTFIRRNVTLEARLEELGRNDRATWKSIVENNGSVQHLEWLPEHDKKVFLTAREINQHALVRQAIQRQKWVDQGQSLNLFFATNSDPKYIHEVHYEAWRGGIKTLYYLRTEGVLRGDLASRSKDECAACEG